MAEIVRTSIVDPQLPTRRTLDERLMLLWPRAWAALAGIVQSLPPRSRLRRFALRQTALSGWGAWVRGDLDVCLARFAPDCHYEPPPEWLLPGMPGAYRGRVGLRQWAADLHDAWDFLDHTPLELVDAGEVVVFRCHTRLRARASGIEFDSQLGQVFWFERGLIAHERDFGDWHEALRAAEIPAAAASATPARSAVSAEGP